MQRLLRLSRGIDRISLEIGHVLGWVVVALVLLGLVNVVGRYLGAHLGMQLGSNLLLEAQTYGFNLIFLLGGCYVLLRDGHIRVDILYGKLAPRTRAWIDLLGAVFLLTPFCLLALVYGTDFVLRSWAHLETSANPGGLPRYPAKTVILLAFALLLLQGLGQAIKRLAWLRGIPGVPGPGDEPMTGDGA